MHDFDAKRLGTFASLLNSVNLCFGMASRTRSRSLR